MSLDKGKELGMFYLKNVPGWERILRVIMGLVALAFAYQNLGLLQSGRGARHNGAQCSQ